MSDTRRFIRDNFVVFFKTILFMVGPIALLTCTLESFYKVNLLQPGETGPNFDKFGSYIALNAIYEQLRWAINGFVTAIVVSHFVKVYREKGPGKFDVNDVGKSIGRDFLGILLAFVILFGAVTLVAVVIGYLMYGMATVSVGAAILIFLAGWLAYILLRYPFWYYIFSVFIARTSRPKPVNVFSAMGIAGKVFSGNWWMTWATFFCMWGLLLLLGTALALPAKVAGMILQMVTTFDVSESSPDWKLVETVLLSLGEFAKTIINSVFCVAVALQFYGLKEKEDGEGTKQLVETIGTKNDDDGIELTY